MTKPVKMDPEVKKAWVEALRSGKYYQGMGGLHYGTVRDNEAFCSLGVLCDLAYKAGIVKRQRSMFFDVYLYGKNLLTDFLPPEVKKWAGVSLFKQEKLAMLNDDVGLSFSEIADVVEKEL